MSKTHELKIWPVYFDAIARGDKTFEVRKNDRDFQAGDTLMLKEWDPSFPPSKPYIPGDPPPLPSAPGFFTSRSLTRVVTYVLHGGQWGLQGDHVVLALREPTRGLSPKSPYDWRGRHETRWSEADDNFIMPDGTHANTRYRQKYYAERHRFIPDGKRLIVHDVTNGEAE